MLLLQSAEGNYGLKCGHVKMGPLNTFINNYPAMSRSLYSVSNKAYFRYFFGLKFCGILSIHVKYMESGSKD